MICRTKPDQTTHRVEDEETAAKRICHRLFSIEQAADFACMPVERICHWIMIGKLREYRVHRGRIRIDELELTDLLSAR
jgi:hypothetical protein